MSRRRQALLAVSILGVVAVLAVLAASAVADPADIDNPPTEDWNFDSGNTVTILGKTWDINYNITVWNGTHLVFDRCTFDLYDMYAEAPVWIEVWSDGSMELKDCTFTTSGPRSFFIVSDGDLTVSSSKLSGMTQPYGRMGGISLMGCTATFDSAEVKDVLGGPAIMAENCDFSASMLTVSGSGDMDNPAVYLYYYGDMDTPKYTISLDECTLSDNEGGGLLVWSRYNWADLDVSIADCAIDGNGRNGIELNLGDRSSYDNSNPIVTVAITRTSITGNHNLAIDTWIVQLNSDDPKRPTLELTMDTCDVSDNNDGGLYIESIYNNVDLAVSVAYTDFMDNCLNPTNWWAGGIYVNEYDHEGAFALVLDNCTFDGNGRNGLSAWLASLVDKAASIEVTGCDFIDGEEYGVWIELYNYHPYLPLFMFDDCEFSSNGQGGIYIYQGWMDFQGYTLDVMDTVFEGPNGDGIASYSGYNTGPIEWTVDGCSFDTFKGRAIDLSVERAGAGASLEVRDTAIADTAGVQLQVRDSVEYINARHMLTMDGVDIMRSNGRAIDVNLYGYYGVRFTMRLDDLGISNAKYNGIRAFATTYYASTTMDIVMDMRMDGVVLEDVDGIGLDLSTDRIQYKGERIIKVDTLTVNNTQKAIALGGMRGEFRSTKISHSARQDLTVQNAEADLYSIDVDTVGANKFQVIESGSVRFWYTLETHVVWDTGVRVENAVVQIMDNHHTFIGVYTQTAVKNVPAILLNSFQLRETGLYTRSPYLIQVTYKSLSKLDTVELDDDRNVTIELTDQTPPSIFINEPADGVLQQALSIKVRGSSFDTESGMATVNISLDGETWFGMSDTTSWTHTFNVDMDEVEMNEGMFTVYAIATDVAGNTASAMSTLMIDHTPPELLVEFPPATGYQTNSHTIQVRGVTELGASVLVNGEAVQVVGTYWYIYFELVEGPNTISVVASDALGNAESETFTVVLDTKAPYIVLMSPAEGAMLVDQTVDVQGQAEDGLVITVNGVQLDSVQYANGLFTYALALSSGENLVHVMAVDPAGNVAEFSRRVWLDDVPPSLMITSPGVDDHSNSKRILVVGSTDQDATLMINDEEVTLDHGTFRYEIMGIEGDNTIHIVAMDESGNVNESTLTVHIDTMAPALTITAPATDGVSVKDAVFTLSGTTQGASGVTINGMGVTLDALGGFSMNATLLEGINLFTVIAKDQAGNTMTETRSVVLDTKAPIIVVRISGLEQDDSGAWVVKTPEGKPVVTIRGNTDDAVRITINGLLVPIGEAGYFEHDLAVQAGAASTVTITAVDSAGNVQTWEQSITHQYIKESDEEGFKIGWALLVLGLIILLLAVVIAFMFVSRAGGAVEEPGAEAIALAPTTAPELDIGDELDEEDEEEIVEEDEEEDVVEEEEEEAVAVTVPASARPKTSAPRRPQPVTPREAPKPLGEEKGLEDQGADAEVGADETDQEGN